jgi:lipopolysaccharide biosynthesis protein
MPDFCLFAHFDKDDRVDDYVLRYLKHIKELNFLIVFVSASRLPLSEVARVRCDCFDVILRDNAGLDFGSWAQAFSKHASVIDGRLLLANDSVYGPVGNLSTALDRLTSRDADFYGLVESIEIAPHLQSWFLLFEPAVVRHPAFKEIWARPYRAMTKRQIITQGEVALSRDLIGAGFRYEALYMCSEAGLFGRYFPINPMHFLWRQLLFEQGVPFLKVELLRDNPVELDDVDRILAAVSSLDSDFSNTIRQHLKRVRIINNRRASSPGLRSLLSRYKRALIRQAVSRHRYCNVGRQKHHQSSDSASL